MMVGDFTLPVLAQSVDTMSQIQLRPLVSSLVRSSQGGGVSAYVKAKNPPVWWPDQVPFVNLKTEDIRKIPNKTDLMRTVVKSCYEYYGKEDMLSSVDTTDTAPPQKPVVNTGVSNHQRREQGQRGVSPVTVDCIPPGTAQDNHESTCTTGKAVHSFDCLESLALTVPRHCSMSGEVKCEPPDSSGSPPEMCNLATLLTVDRDTKTSDEENSFLEIFICFFCEKEFQDKCELQHHQSACTMQPPTLHAINDLPQPDIMPIRPPRLCVDSPDLYERGDRKVFTEFLGLCLKSKAEALENKNKDRKVDCDVIDVGGRVPKTPTTPRTPKSLISQLSKEGSSSPHCSIARPLLPASDLPINASSSSSSSEDEDSDSESDCSKSDSVAGNNRKTTLRCRSLLMIDFCSPLGQRVKKHLCSEEPQAAEAYDLDKVCSNSFKFCHSPTKKNVGDRLRSRGVTIPVTFRKSKRTAPDHWHKYKFTRQQRIEHYLRTETGLNARSRKLLKKVKKCSVNLQKLTRDDLHRFTARIHPSFNMLTEEEVEMWTRKHSPGFSDTDLDLSEEDGIFPQGPGLMGNRSELQRLLGLKTHQDMNSRECSPVRPLELSQVVSEDDNAEVNQQKVLVYRTLLSELTRTPELPAAVPLSIPSHDLTPPSTPEDQLSLQDLTFDSSMNPTVNSPHRALSLTSLNETSPNGHRHPSVTHMPELHKLLQSKHGDNLDITQHSEVSGGKNNRTSAKPPVTETKRRIVETGKIGTKEKVKKHPKSGQSSCERDPALNKLEVKRSSRTIRTRTVINTEKSAQKTTSSRDERAEGKNTTVSAGNPSQLGMDAPELKTAGLKQKLVSTKKPAEKDEETKNVGKNPVKPLQCKIAKQSIMEPAPDDKKTASVKNSSKVKKTMKTSCKKTSSAKQLQKNKVKGPSALKGQAGVKEKDAAKGPSNKKHSHSTRHSPTDSKVSVSAKPKHLKRPLEKIEKNESTKTVSATCKQTISYKEHKVLPKRTSSLSRKRKVETSSDQQPSKYLKTDKGRHAAPSKPLLLFRCHLCGAEIACREKFKELVIEHFDTVHKVHSIRLVEQEGPDGQTILSIVEDLTLPSSPQHSAKPKANHTMSSRSKKDSGYNPASDPLWDPVDRCLFGDKKQQGDHVTGTSASVKGTHRRNISGPTIDVDAKKKKVPTATLR